MKQIEVGVIVRLWCMATEYGVITKVNKKSFAVHHNAGGRTLFNINPSSRDEHICTGNVFRCNILSDANNINKVYQMWLYRGPWFTEKLDIAILNQYPKLARPLTTSNQDS